MSAADRSITDLLALLCDESISVEEMQRLDHLICTDPLARRLYLEYLDLHARLSFQGGVERNDECGMRNEELPSQAGIVIDLQAAASIDHSSLNIQHSYLGGVLFSYMIATLIIGTALAVAWMWKLPGYTQIAVQSVPNPSSLAPSPSSKMAFVGQVTGMVDCQWADAKTATIDRAYIPAGRTYALASGLMEITYNTGAKVILQGPVTYRVESKSGGYLWAGKLAAKVEKRSEIANQKSEILNQKSSLSTTHDPLFTIKTPTATVTDLGTEFGVEVNKEGETTSHVFRGSVELQVTAEHGTSTPMTRVLHANESARVATIGGNGPTVVGASVKPAAFVREIPKRTIKVFDLVDVVAGGNGFSGRRNAGIDLGTGRLTTVPPPDGHVFAGDGKYHRVEGMPFVDGVFVPNGDTGAVQLDSAGHTFAEFGTRTDMTAEHVWACGTITMPPAATFTVPTTLNGIDYASDGHGFIFMHANKGITFDLAAIRNANSDGRLAQFQSVAGSTGGMADLWVFVDGRLRFRRWQINDTHGGFPIVIPIAPHERFLTLVATDGGDGIGGDWVLFGDPRLELVPVATKVGPVADPERTYTEEKAL